MMNSFVSITFKTYIITIFHKCINALNQIKLFKSPKKTENIYQGSGITLISVLTILNSRTLKTLLAFYCTFTYLCCTPGKVSC